MYIDTLLGLVIFLGSLAATAVLASAALVIAAAIGRAIEKMQ